MVIYLIRHGETNWNRQNRLQGTEDIALNEKGLRQAVVCAEAFADVPVDCVVSSPLQRAKVTADIISVRTGVAPVIVEEGLTERDFGKLSGITLQDRKTMLAQDGALGMEPSEELTARLMRVLNRYLSENKHAAVIAVSHGASINAVLAHLTNGEIGTGKTTLKNTCISKLTVTDETFVIDFYNVTPDEFVQRKNV